MESFYLSYALSALALICSIVSVLFHYRTGSASDISTRVRALDTDLSNLSDQVNHWIRRAAVRNAREGKEEKANAMQFNVAPGDRKAAIRARVLQGKNNVQ